MLKFIRKLLFGRRIRKLREFKNISWYEAEGRFARMYHYDKNYKALYIMSATHYYLIEGVTKTEFARIQATKFNYFSISEVGSHKKQTVVKIPKK